MVHAMFDINRFCLGIDHNKMTGWNNFPGCVMSLPLFNFPLNIHSFALTACEENHVEMFWEEGSIHICTKLEQLEFTITW